VTPERVHHVPPGRCLLRQPPEAGEAQRIPRFTSLLVPPIVYFLFCPACGRRGVVRDVVEANPQNVTETVETSDGGERTVTHLVPELTVPAQTCACGSRWSVSNGTFVVPTGGC
jgi:hypothetical protein